MKDSGEGARNLGTSLARATHFARLLRSGVEIQGVSSTPISSRASKLSRKAWHFIAQNQARRGHVLVNKADRAKLEGGRHIAEVACIPDDHDVRVREVGLRQAQGFGEIITLPNTNQDQHLLAGV